MGTGFGATGILVVVVLALILVVCWIILPFAIIGTKPLLRQLLAEQRKTNDLLALRRTAPPPDMSPDISATRG